LRRNNPVRCYRPGSRQCSAAPPEAAAAVAVVTPASGAHLLERALMIPRQHARGCDFLGRNTPSLFPIDAEIRPKILASVAFAASEARICAESSLRRCCRSRRSQSPCCELRANDPRAACSSCAEISRRCLRPGSRQCRGRQKPRSSGRLSRR